MLKKVEKKYWVKASGGFRDKEKALSSDDKKTYTRWIVWWVVLFIIIIFSVFGDSSTTTQSSKTTNPWKDYSSTCIGSNGYTYSRPVNAFCDNRKTPQWWSCEQWYKPTKWEWQVWRYCKCSAELLQCPTQQNTVLAPMQGEYDRLALYLITANINPYNHSAVDYYNAQVAKHNELASRINKYMSESCVCR